MKVGNMKSKLGYTLRKIRQSKQVSLCSLADEYLSKSQISRFERGESEISCIRLIHILNKLHISLDEFLALHNEECAHTMSFDELIQYIRKEYSLQNINNIKSLLIDSKNYHLNSFEKTMIKSIINTLDCNISPSKKEIQKLTDYLFKIDNWGYYEITLLANCIRTIPYNTVFLLTKELLKKYIYSASNKTNKRLVAQLAINCLIVSIDYNELHNCTFLINEIEKLLDNELNFYEQTVFLYATGYFELKKNNKNGLKKMKQALLIFESLGEHNIKVQYQEHYDKFVNKNPK